MDALSNKESVVDFIRNFLVSQNMNRTMTVFQQEWYAMNKKDDSLDCPDVYVVNRELQSKITRLQQQLQKAEDLAKKSANVTENTVQEKNHHRLQHRRLLQDKSAAETALKRVVEENHMMKEQIVKLQTKVEVLLREKSLFKTQRDKALSQTQELIMNPDNTSTPKVQPKVQKRLKQPGKQSLHNQPQKHVLAALPSKSIQASSPFQSSAPLSEERLAAISPARALHVSDSPVCSIAVNNNETILATGDDDGILTLWSLPSGQVLRKCAAKHKAWISHLEFGVLASNQDMKESLISSSGDGSCRVWDVESGEAIFLVGQHGHAVWDCSLHKSGTAIATACQDGQARIWDLMTSSCRHTLRSHTDAVTCCTFVGNTLCTGGVDGQVFIWNASTGRVLHKLEGHLNSISGLTLSLNQEVLVSCDRDGTVIQWNYSSAQQIGITCLKPHMAHGLSVDATSKTVAVAATDTLHMLDISLNDRSTDNIPEICVLDGHDDEVLSVIIEKSGTYVVTSSADGRVLLWT